MHTQSAVIARSNEIEVGIFEPLAFVDNKDL